MHFLNKLNQLMSSEKVLKCLNELQKEKEEINSKNFDIDKFTKDEINVENEKSTADLLKSFEDSNKIIPLKINRNSQKSKENIDYIQNKISSLDSNLNKIKDNMSSDLKNQRSQFDEIKKNKMERMKILKERKKNNIKLEEKKEEQKEFKKISKNENIQFLKNREEMYKEINEMENMIKEEMEKEIEIIKEDYMKDIIGKIFFFNM